MEEKGEDGDDKFEIEFERREDNEIVGDDDPTGESVVGDQDFAGDDMGRSIRLSTPLPLSLSMTLPVSLVPISVVRRRRQEAGEDDRIAEGTGAGGD